MLNSIDLNSFEQDLKIIKERIYDKCSIDFSSLNQHAESREYGACSYKLNSKLVQHRFAKITPKKIGQFVTIWQRNKDGKTVPFNFIDELDFIIITVKSGVNFGQFVFPKNTLAEKGIITQNKKIGKCGMRVYAPWDVVLSKQAIKTQSWQSKYFFYINRTNAVQLEKVKQLLE